MYYMYNNNYPKERREWEKRKKKQLYISLLFKNAWILLNPLTEEKNRRDCRRRRRRVNKQC